jgi:hypothetical protein
LEPKTLLSVLETQNAVSAIPLRGIYSAPQKFQAMKGKWIGAKVGLYSVKPAGAADVGWVDANHFLFE